MGRSKAKSIILSVILRYSLILILSLFYPLLNILLAIPTIYLSYFIIGLSHPASLSGAIISFDNIEIELIGACISGLAYLLLIALNLSVEMPLKTRMKALSLSILAFFAFNLLRISLLALLFSSGSQLFSYLHAFFWYAGSIIAVFLIWIFEVRVFKIGSIPFISDVAWLVEKTRFKTKTI